MIFTAQSRFCVYGALLLGLLLPQARALLNIDGTRNQIFVFGRVALNVDSNVFSDSTNRDDFSIATQIGAELKRRAGIIAINATAKADYVRYDQYSDESGLNPSFSIEFKKSTGRTTGAITLQAFRESRSDSAVNLRTESWNFPLGLSLRYPINEKLYLTSASSYLHRRYEDTAGLADYTDYSQGLDLYYVYTSKLDLVGGYRIRISRTSNGNDASDHWFSVGATGGLFSKLNGTVRIGYQLRDASGATQENFSQLNAMAGVGWPVTRKLTLNGQLSRDFNTIATGSSVDSTAGNLQVSYAITRKLELHASAGYGRNTFLGRTQPGRTDNFFSFDLGAQYTMNEHLQIGAGYTYFRNWSTLSFSDFDRQGFSVDVSSRY